MARILGIDPGRHVVRGALLRTVLRRGEVVRYLEEPLVLPDDEDVDPDATPEERRQAARRSAIARLVARLEPPPDQTIVAIDGRDASLRTVDIPAAAQKRAGEVLPFELEQLLPFENEDIVLDHQPVERDGPSLRLLVATVPRDKVSDLLSDLAAAEVDPKEIAVGGAALDGLARLVPELGEGTALVLSMGGDRAELCVLREGQAAFARTIAVRDDDPFRDGSRLAGEIRRSLASYRASGGTPPDRAWITGELPALDEPPPEDDGEAATADHGSDGPEAAADPREATDGDDDGRDGADGGTDGDGGDGGGDDAAGDAETERSKLAQGAAPALGADGAPGPAPASSAPPPAVVREDDDAARWLHTVTGLEALRVPLPLVPGAEPAVRSRFGGAVALAARVLDRDKRIDLRRGEFAYTRTVGTVQRFLRLAAVAAAAVLLAFAFATFARYRVVTAERETLTEELARVTEETFGTRTESATRARDLLERGSRDADPIPDIDALDYLEYVSEKIAPDIPHSTRTFLVELGDEGGEGRFELSGSVGSIAERDQIAAAMEKHACLRDLDRGSTSAAPGSDGRLRYQLEADVRCGGDEDDEGRDRGRRRSRGARR